MEYSQITAKYRPNEPVDPLSRHRRCSRVMLGVWLLTVTGVAAMAEITPTPTTDVRVLLIPDLGQDLGELGRSDDDILLTDDDYVALGADSLLEIGFASLLRAGAIGANPNDPGTFTVVVDGGTLDVISINSVQVDSVISNFLIDGATAGTLARATDDVFVGAGPGSFGDLRVLEGATFSVNQTGESLALTNNLPFRGSGVIVGAAGGTGTALVDNNAVMQMIRESSAVGDDSIGLIVGWDGTGTATFDNDSTLSITDAFGIDGVDGIVIGQAGDSAWEQGPTNGSMVVTGGSGVWITSAQGVIQIGTSFSDSPESAVGTLDVLDGSFIQFNGGAAGLSIGRGGNADGSMTVSGAGTQVRLDGAASAVLVGTNAQATNEPALTPGNGRGSLTVSDFARFFVTADTPDQALFIVGDGAGDGEVLVDTGAMIEVDGLLQVSRGDFATTQTGLLTINDTGVVNALTTVVGNRGTITGTGTLNTDLLTVVDGVVSLTHLSGVAAAEILGGMIDVPNDLVVGELPGQTISVLGGLLQVDGNLTVESDTALTTVEIAVGTESFATATTTTVGNLGQLIGFGSLTTDLLTLEPGGFVGLADLSQIGAIDVAGTLDAPNDLILGAALPQTMALNAGGVANILGTLFVGGEAPATLGGNGGQLFAAAVVVNSNGVVGPGNSVGTLDIIGDLTLGGGELLFEIAGTDPGQYDILNVDGDVALDSGTLRFLPIDGFSPTGADTNLDVLFATGALALESDVEILGDGLGPDFMFTIDGNVGTVEFLAMDIGPVVDDPPPVADGDDIAGGNGSEPEPATDGELPGRSVSASRRA